MKQHVLFAGAFLVLTAFGQERQPLPFFHKNDVILFHGDSITDGGRQRTGRDFNHIMGQDYEYILAAQVGAEYPDRNLDFENRAIGSERVLDLAARWQTDALDIRPNMLSILVGINDTLMVGDKAETVDQFERIYDKLLANTIAALPNTKIIIGEPFLLPVGKHELTYTIELAELQKRQAIVRRLASKYHAAIVPYQEVFNKACLNAPPKYWSWDGIHPTYAGHALMAKAWLQAASAYWPKG